MNSRILLVEDDARLAAMVADYLREAGLRPTIAPSLGDAESRLKHEDFDAVILDLMLPDGDGLDLCRRVRSESAIPILMLTARGDPLDRVIGLELGADDYLPKPFEPRELLARLRAIMRRQQSVGSLVMRFGELEIDRATRQVRVNGQERSLTSYQFNLLSVLAERAGRVLSRDTLADLTKGSGCEDFDRSIDVHISRIRAAIEDDPRKPKRILTLRGAGYLFAREQNR